MKKEERELNKRLKKVSKQHLLKSLNYYVAKEKAWKGYLILLVIFTIMLMAFFIPAYYFEKSSNKLYREENRLLRGDIKEYGEAGLKTQEGYSRGFLEEYRCDGDYIQQKYKASNGSLHWLFFELCTFGCENVKCKPCYDSDGGKDYYTKGYLYYSTKGKVYDECYKGGPVLTEMYCKSEDIETENLGMDVYTCPNGCSDGRCTSGTTSGTQEIPRYEIGGELLDDLSAHYRNLGERFHNKVAELMDKLERDCDSGLPYDLCIKCYDDLIAQGSSNDKALLDMWSDCSSEILDKGQNTNENLQTIYDACVNKLDLKAQEITQSFINLFNSLGC